MILENLKINSLPNGKTEVLFICSQCRKVMDEPYRAKGGQINNAPWKTEYICKYCYQDLLAEVEEAARKEKSWVKKLAVHRMMKRLNLMR